MLLQCCSNKTFISSVFYQKCFIKELMMIKRISQEERTPGNRNIAKNNFFFLLVYLILPQHVTATWNFYNLYWWKNLFLLFWLCFFWKLWYLLINTLEQKKLFFSADSNADCVRGGGDYILNSLVFIADCKVHFSFHFAGKSQLEKFARERSWLGCAVGCWFLVPGFLRFSFLSISISLKNV